MSGPRARVFVSSVVDGFKDFRAAARRGIQAAGADAILVNEDHPASSTSSRNACLDLVESSDIYVLIIGERGGWTAPSGKLVVEEEFEHARNRRIHQLVFLQDGTRDVDAMRLAALVSDYTNGVYRRTFKNQADLEREVEAAVRNALKPMSLPTTPPESITTSLSAPGRSGGSPSLRFAIAPERQEEVITPMDIESRDFARKMLEIGHAGSIPLLNYEHGKEHAVKNGALTIEQAAGKASWGDATTVRLFESGKIEIETGLGGLRRDQFSSGVELQVEDIERALRACFSFARFVYQHLDPHGRHARLQWGTSIADIGYRLITRDTSKKQSYGMRMGRSPGALVALDEPRLIERRELDDPTSEIARAVTMFERKANR